MDYQKAAKDVLAAIGGKENVVSAAHSATRLRLVIATTRRSTNRLWRTVRASRASLRHRASYR